MWRLHHCSSRHIIIAVISLKTNSNKTSNVERQLYQINYTRLSNFPAILHIHLNYKCNFIHSCNSNRQINRKSTEQKKILLSYRRLENALYLFIPSLVHWNPARNNILTDWPSQTVNNVDLVLMVLDKSRRLDYKTINLTICIPPFCSESDDKQINIQTHMLLIYFLLVVSIKESSLIIL